MSDDLRRILDDLQANEASADAVIKGLTESQLRWQATQGRSWSILQCLEHLTLSNTGYATAMRQVLNTATRTRHGAIQPSALGRLFLQRLEPPVPVRNRVRAPRVIVPAASKSPREVMDGFLASHERIRAIIRDGSRLDLNRIKFRNPLFRLLRVRIGTGLLIITAHERRHLWQANQVRQALEASGQTTT